MYRTTRRRYHYHHDPTTRWRSSSLLVVAAAAAATTLGTAWGWAMVADTHHHHHHHHRRHRRRHGLLQSTQRTSCSARDAVHRTNEASPNEAPSSSSSSSSSWTPTDVRSYQTPVDVYYQQHHELPYPTEPHVVLSWNENDHHDDEEEDISNIQRDENKPSNDDKQRQRQQQRKKGILVIGDVHGCYDELVELHRKAVEEVGHDFRYVILVGDLCNKGPSSCAVIRHCRQNKDWITVRGNHDNAALHAALGDVRRREDKNSKYSWAQHLTDDDVMWMAELPYTIRIPKHAGSNVDRDYLIVHAGLQPSIPLDQQSIGTMTTIRTTTTTTTTRSTNDDPPPNNNHDNESETQQQPWASVWSGPEHVIFGHDAKRGLQQHKYATGLDTGCVYGKRLTGLILSGSRPEYPPRLVSVPAKHEYCPINR